MTTQEHTEAKELPSPEERFVEFQYLEIKDLAKQFLTLIAGTLVLTVSFADRILPLSYAQRYQKILLGSCWILLLVSFVLAGLGVFTNYLAAIAARQGAIFDRAANYKWLLRRAYFSLDAAGVLFAFALLLLAITGTTRLFFG